MDNKIISYYSNTFARDSSQLNLFEELKRIKEGFYAEPINLCRKFIDGNDLVGYKNIKLTLPAVTFSGHFDSERKKESLTSYSQYIVIDIDNVSTLEINSIKDQLANDDFVFAVWISPSNRGLKVLFCTDASPLTHKYYFDSIARYLGERYELKIDKSGSDISRLCFCSYDPDIYIKENNQIYTVDVISDTNLNVGTGDKAIGVIKIEIASINLLDKQLYYSTDNRNSRFDREMMSKIITFLQKKNLSITSTYDNWFRVALAIANTFTIDLGQKYFLKLCLQDGSSNDEYKSINMLDHCYRNRKLNVVTFGTILHLAEQLGFEVNKKNTIIK